MPSPSDPSGPPDPASAISLRGLTKNYGRLTALRDVDLDVRPSETLGFLGLNGAGKTTTIRILLDLLRPTRGRAMALGLDCRRDGLRLRGRVGFLPGEMGYYGEMTGGALLDLLARLGGARATPPRRGELLDRMELARSDLGRRLREYSTGMKRKLGIVQAFQADPELLILDEPTEGLDPLMQEAFYGLLSDARAAGRTVFISSHVLSEVERVCDRIALLRQGELVLLAGVEETRRLAPRRVRIDFGADVQPPGAGLPPEIEAVDITPRGWSLAVRGAMGPLLARLAGLPVTDMEVVEPRLEEVVARYYRGGPA